MKSETAGSALRGNAARGDLLVINTALLRFLLRILKTTSNHEFNPSCSGTEIQIWERRPSAISNWKRPDTGQILASPHSIGARVRYVNGLGCACADLGYRNRI